MRAVTALLLAFLSLTPVARAAFHVMQVEEIIGSLNGNTSAQAIQLRMRSSGQNQVQFSSVWAWDAAGLNRVLLFDIGTSVTNSASGARILLASSAFTSTMIAGGASTFTPDFTLASNIPFPYLNAGRLTFEDDSGNTATAGTIYWSVAWGGASYTGSVTGSTQNDADGNFGKFGLGLREPGIFAPGLIFTGAATAASTNNAADYAYTTGSTPGSVTVTKNSGTAFTVVPEPDSAALLAAGVLGLGAFAFARRRGLGSLQKPLLLLLACAAPLLFATAAETAPKPDRLLLTTTLAAEDFWEHEPAKAWTAGEVTLLEEMAASSESPVIRIRATKLLIDLAGGGRATAKDTPIVAAGFRYLEQHLKDPAIIRFLAAPRMTHYTVSRQTDGSSWFLLETVQSPNSGGLNFRWDAEKKQIELAKSWGSLAEK